MLGSTGQGSTAGQGQCHQPLATDTTRVLQCLLLHSKTLWVPSQGQTSAGESPVLSLPSSPTGPGKHLFPVPEHAYLSFPYHLSWEPGERSLLSQLVCPPWPHSHSSALCLFSASTVSKLVLWDLLRQVRVVSLERKSSIFY